MSEKLIIQENPDIVVTGQNLYDFPNARVESVKFGAGELAVNLDAASHLSERHQQAAFLAALGLSNPDIGRLLYLSEGHLKSFYIGAAMKQIGIQKRNGFARHFFDVNAFVPVTKHPPLNLWPRELEALDLFTQGYTNKEIGSRMHLAEKTTKAYIYEAGKRNDISGRIELGLAALMAGQIEGYPAANLPPPEENK